MSERRDWMADEIHDLRVDKARLEDEVRWLRRALALILHANRSEAWSIAADALNAVTKAILLQIATIATAPQSPALATTQPKRRYIITPRIVSTLGVNTPKNAPNL